MFYVGGQEARKLFFSSSNGQVNLVDFTQGTYTFFISISVSCFSCLNTPGYQVLFGGAPRIEEAKRQTSNEFGAILLKALAR